MAKKQKLTAKEAKFVEEYLIDLNASAAARRAGYSEKIARVVGHRLLTKDNIQAALTIARQELSAKTGITPQMVIEGFARGAFYDPADFYDERGYLKNIHDIPKEARVALAGMETFEVLTEGKEGKKPFAQVRKIKNVSRHQNLDSLAKHFGLYDADNRQKTDPIKELLKAIDGKGLPQPGD